MGGGPETGNLVVVALVMSYGQEINHNSGYQMALVLQSIWFVSHWPYNIIVLWFNRTWA